MWSTTPIGKLWCSFNDDQQCVGITIQQHAVSHENTEFVSSPMSRTPRTPHHTSSQQNSKHYAIAHIVRQQLQEYFGGLRTRFDIPIIYTGTPFQMRVWKQIETIPYGSCISYKDIAVAIGAPRSYRAVGHAVGLNPLPIIVPCHRVVRSDGTIGEYALNTIGKQGQNIKKFLLELESHNTHLA